MLDAADALRAKRRQAIAKLDTLTQAIFIDMFGDLSEMQTLEDVMEKIIDYRGKSPTKTDSGVPLLTARVVKNFRLEPATEFIAEADYDSWMRRGLPRTGDVLFTTEAPLGHVAQIEESRVALAQRLVLLRPKNELMTGEFLMFALRSTQVVEGIRRRATGSTVIGIRQKELRKVLLPVPPLSLQSQFSKRVHSLQRFSISASGSLSQLDTLFSSLQQRAFRGEL